MKGVTGEYTTEADRLQEINFVVNIIDKLCTECGIRLIAKERKGINLVAVQDAFNGDKEYMITNNK